MFIVYLSGSNRMFISPGYFQSNHATDEAAYGVYRLWCMHQCLRAGQAGEKDRCCTPAVLHRCNGAECESTGVSASSPDLRDDEGRTGGDSPGGADNYAGAG